MMGGAMKLGCAQQTGIIYFSQMVHQMGNELLWWQTASGPVFGREDHIEFLVG
jgi:hypothetical protein